MDAWSFVHVASGVGLALVGIGVALAILALVLYEVFEAVLRRHHSGWGWFEYESWPNIVADVILGLAGYGLAIVLMSRPALVP